MPATPAIPDLDALLGAVRSDALLVGSAAHGEGHWLAVAATGLDLHAHAVNTTLDVPDPLLLVLFGLLHDCRRENEQRDPGHGPRAADLTRGLSTAGLLRLAPAELDVIVEACTLHDTGAVNERHATIGACYDSDRLQLPRVGIAVSHSYISTPSARDADLGERVLSHHNNQALSWEHLIARAASARRGLAG